MKTILFDADGVTLKRQTEYFSERFAREYNVPLVEVVSFFKNEFRLCQQGKADLKEELSKKLPAWGWQKSTDDFLLYWFTTDTIPNDAVMSEVENFRRQGTKCYLVTDQEKYRAEYLRDTLNFKNRFDGCFFSCELGYSKSEPAFFATVIIQLNLPPDEIVYWDDDQKNVDAAESLGIDARFYSGIFS